MTGIGRSSEGLDVRRRKLLFRAWHRGLREVDLILGRFADGNIEQLTEADLSEFESLMDVPDGELLAWLTGEAEVPASHDGPLFRRLRDFRAQPGERLTMAKSPAELLEPGRPLTLAGVADGAEGLVVADLARAIAAGSRAPATSLVVVCRDGPRMAALARALTFFAPDMAVLEFPAWDCLPYDRVSPHAGVVAQRMTALARLSRLKGHDRPSILLTTVNAALQRVPAREMVATQSLSVAPGNVLDMEGITRWLELNGFTRASTVREPGDYAVRGGIIDLYAPGHGRAGAVRFLRRSARVDPQLRSGDPAQHRPVARSSISCRSRNSSSPPKPSGASAWAMWKRSARRRRTICSMRRSAKAAAMPAWSTGCRCSTRAWRRSSTTCPARRWCSNRWTRMPRASGSTRSRTTTRRACRRWRRATAARRTGRCRRIGSISPKPNGRNG